MNGEKLLQTLCGQYSLAPSIELGLRGCFKSLRVSWQQSTEALFKQMSQELDLAFLTAFLKTFMATRCSTCLRGLTNL